MRRPSPKLYPEYYIVINKPIDFREISRKIKEENVSSNDPLSLPSIPLSFFPLLCSPLSLSPSLLSSLSSLPSLSLYIQYKTLEELMDDIELLVNNACTFNEENSQIHTVSHVTIILVM